MAKAADQNGTDADAAIILDLEDASDFVHVMLMQKVPVVAGKVQGDRIRKMRDKKPVLLKELVKHNPHWAWKGDGDFVYDTILGSALRRLYMDSRLRLESLHLLWGAWDVQNAGKADRDGEGFPAPVLQYDKNYQFDAVELLDFLDTLDGQAILEAASRKELAVEDVLCVACEWVSTIHHRFTEAEAAGGMNVINMPDDNLLVDDAELIHEEPDSTDPPANAVLPVNVEPYISAMREWKQLIDAGALTNKLEELPQLVPLPRHLGGRGFGVRRVHKKVLDLPNIDLPNGTVKGILDKNISDELVAEVVAGLAEDDLLVQRIKTYTERGRFGRGYSVDVNWLVDEQCGEQYAAGKELYLDAELVSRSPPG